MTNEAIVRDFIQTAGNEKNIDRIPNFLAPTYTIHRDYQDLWEGKFLTREVVSS